MNGKPIRIHNWVEDSDDDRAWLLDYWQHTHDVARRARLLGDESSIYLDIFYGPQSLDMMELLCFPNMMPKHLEWWAIDSVDETRNAELVDRRVPYLLASGARLIKLFQERRAGR